MSDPQYPDPNLERPIDIKYLERRVRRLEHLVHSLGGQTLAVEPEEADFGPQEYPKAVKMVNKETGKPYDLVVGSKAEEDRLGKSDTVRASDEAERVKTDA